MKMRDCLSRGSCGYIRSAISRKSDCSGDFRSEKSRATQREGKTEKWASIEMKGALENTIGWKIIKKDVCLSAHEVTTVMFPGM